MSKIKDRGTASFGLKAERRVGCASAPCSGYYSLEEYTSRDSTARINAPSMFDLIARALGGHPEFGSKFRIDVTVTVVEKGRPSEKKCHNPWPAHTCREKRKPR